MKDKCKSSVFTKPRYLSRIVAWTKSSLIRSASSCSGATPSTRTPSRPVCWCQAYTCQPCQRRVFLILGSPPVRVLVSFQGLIWWWFDYVWRIEKEKSERKGKWKFNVEMFSLFDVKIIQIPSAERVPSLAERVAYSRYSINLRLFNWRVPALMVMEEINQSSSACSPLQGSGLASVWHGYIYMSGWLLPEVNLWYSLNHGP